MDHSEDTLRAAMREMGRRGGIASRASLTPEQRKENAKKAVAARWKRFRKRKKQKELA